MDGELLWVWGPVLVCHLWWFFLALGGGDRLAMCCVAVWRLWCRVVMVVVSQWWRWGRRYTPSCVPHCFHTPHYTVCLGRFLSWSSRWGRARDAVEGKEPHR